MQSEEDAFQAVVNAFTVATGIKVTVSSESYDDVQPKASVAAHTSKVPISFGAATFYRIYFWRSAWTYPIWLTIWDRRMAAGFQQRAHTARAGGVGYQFLSECLVPF